MGAYLLNRPAKDGPTSLSRPLLMHHQHYTIFIQTWLLLIRIACHITRSNTPLPSPRVFFTFQSCIFPSRESRMHVERLMATHCNRPFMMQVGLGIAMMDHSGSGDLARSVWLRQSSRGMLTACCCSQGTSQGELTAGAITLSSSDCICFENIDFLIIGFKNLYYLSKNFNKIYFGASENLYPTRGCWT